MYKKLNYILVWTILLIIPINLGYHFVLNSAYIEGLLVDYLVPTLYFQDIFIGLFVLLNLKTLKQHFLKTDKFLIWFLFSLLLSAIASFFVVSSISVFARTLLFVCFSLILQSKYRLVDMLPKVFVFHVVLLSLLGIAQWINQGSVFNNYLFFGEQPYSSSTFGINRENHFSSLKVPSYGTFRHPNVFGGYLSIALVWIAFQLKKKARVMVLALGCIALYFTLSYFAWLSFLVGIIYVLKPSKALIAFVTIIAVSSFLLPLFPQNENPSFYRRSDLLESSYKLLQLRPLFGFGPSTSAAYIDKLVPVTHDIRFAQPPHNVLVLILVESGFITALLFFVFILRQIKTLKLTPLLFATFLQFIILGSFDHYLFTIHQTQLLFWILILL